MDNFEKQNFARGLIAFAQDELQEAAFKMHDGEVQLAASCANQAIIMAVAARDSLAELAQAAEDAEASGKLKT